jgi:hypothetical protein
VLILGLLFPKWPLLAFGAGIAGLIVTTMRSSDEMKNWIDSTWMYTLMIAPLLLGGVLVAGFLLGMPGTHNGIIPSRWIAGLVGGNSLFANFFASLAGAFMYFATLTEVPIVQGLLGSGMAQGALTCRTRALAAEHARTQQHNGHQEDGRVRDLCGITLHHRRHAIRVDCRLITFLWGDDVKKVFIIVLMIGLAGALQACAAFYSCETGGPPVQYRIDQNVERPSQEK